jgi:hypothetical protein
MRGRGIAALAIVLALGACGSGQIEPFAQVASSNGSIGVGEQRILFALIDPESNEFLASPDREATVTIRDENGSPLDTYPLEFVWTVPDVRGLYMARVDIPEAATYQATIEAEGMAEAGPAGFVAYDDLPLIEAGEKAPRSETRTASEFPDLSVITSDPEPDPALYQTSVADSVSSGTPSVIVFATPAFCTSNACGPLLDQVKALRPEFDGVNFVHVEIYEDLQVESVEDLTPVPAITEWGLPSEPWVFVVDGAGVVTSNFEGAASEQELRSAIEEVAG